MRSWLVTEPREFKCAYTRHMSTWVETEEDRANCWANCSRFGRTCAERTRSANSSFILCQNLIVSIWRIWLRSCTKIIPVPQNVSPPPITLRVEEPHLKSVEESWVCEHFGTDGNPLVRKYDTGAKENAAPNGRWDLLPKRC